LEDFNSINTTANTVGDNGWGLSTIGSAGSVAKGVSVANFSGIINLSTNATATAGQGASLSPGIGASTDAFFNLNSTGSWNVNTRFKLVQTTDTRFWGGLIADPA